EPPVQLTLAIEALDDDRHERPRGHVEARHEVVGHDIQPKLVGEIRRVERHIESTAHAPIFSFHYTVDNGGRREYSDQIRPDRGVPAAVAGPWLGRGSRWHDHGDLGDEDPPALPRPRGRSAQALRPHLLPLRSP